MDKNSKICKLYKDGKSNKFIAKKFNINRSTVQRILKKNNIILRKQQHTSRIYKIKNERYFEKIDSAEKAYFLGILYADGYISKNCVEISLQKIDQDILKKLSKIIYGKSVLKYRKAQIKLFNNKQYKQKEQTRFTFTSNKIVKDLKNHGLMENKSLKIRFPYHINKNLYSHFIRGYFDGDGCICLSKKWANNSLSIVSNYDFCFDLQNVIKKYVNVNIYVRNKTIYYFFILHIIYI
jgi:intein/homing endonuclease